MASYSQAGRAMALTTPLGKDVLLIVGLTGREAISTLFSFHLDLLATNDTAVAFDKLLGQKISVKMLVPADKERYFSGIVQSVSQGKRDETFTSYRIDMVPQFWLWTKKVQSRIFQHVSVPEILKQVFTGLDVTFEIQGTFHPRDYCVQYRESDFDFASRLMEEEGIYYYFTHSADGNKMIVANTPRSHRDVPVQPQVVYEEVTGGTRKDMRITDWEKTQEVRSGKFTLWDHCFELPHKHLQAEKTIQDAVAIGKVTHKLNVANNVSLEIYDYPGAYAQRFDGINRGGGDNAGDLRYVFEDNIRTAEIRMQQEALPGVVIHGSGNCRQFVSGHKFALQRHFNADGDYVLTSVDHAAKLGDDYRSGQVTEFKYENHFTSIPLALPFRAPSTTEKPTIQGTQTAVVVGPPGEVIFCDKYGRVKVQFFWDRQGKKNADSSCWIRVGQTATGPGFGAISMPRIGHEVIVAFLEGDPDQPIIVGCVFNAENMPPYPLPELRTYSGHIHRSHHGVVKNANEIRFQNQLGSELMLLHAETDSIHQAENNHLHQIGNVHRHEVGKFYHTIIGKPVNVNQAAVAPPPSVTGSGAGGGQPLETPAEDWSSVVSFVFPVTGSGAGGGPGAPSDATTQDANLIGAFVQIYGDNTTDTYGNNSTLITGNDTYKCDGSATANIGGNNTTHVVGTDTFTATASNSSVSGITNVFEGVENSMVLSQNEVKIAHLEATGIHIEANGMHMEFTGFSGEKTGIKMFETEAPPPAAGNFPAFPTPTGPPADTA